jgi:hypothetical protein
MVGVPQSNVAVSWTPMFEWGVGGCGSKNGHQTDIMSFKEIRLVRAQNRLIIIGSAVVSIVEGLI